MNLISYMMILKRNLGLLSEYFTLYLSVLYNYFELLFLFFMVHNIICHIVSRREIILYVLMYTQLFHLRLN